MSLGSKPRRRTECPAPVVPSFSTGREARFMVELIGCHTVKTLRNSLCCIVVLYVFFRLCSILPCILRCQWQLHCIWSHCASERCCQYLLTGNRSCVRLHRFPSESILTSRSHFCHLVRGDSVLVTGVHLVRCCMMRSWDKDSLMCQRVYLPVRFFLALCITPSHPS